MAPAPQVFPQVCVYAHEGKPMVMARGPMPPFAVYEVADGLEIQISTFNLDVEVDPELSHSGSEFGMWLRADPSAAAVAPHGPARVLHTSLSTQGAICSGRQGKAATEPLESRIDVSLSSYFDPTRIEFFITRTRLRIAMPKKAGNPKPLRLNVHKVQDDND